MVMATQYFTGKVPFREVYINAIVRDAEGQKMSKSKGNTIDPLDLIDGIDLDALVKKSTSSLLIPQVREKVEKRIRKDYPDGIPGVGADALRFTFAALATYGRTINFDLKRADGYKNFCNKLWNAARFVLMNCETSPPAPGEGGAAAPGQGWEKLSSSAPAPSVAAEPSSDAAHHRLPAGEAAIAQSDAEKWILTRFERALADVEAQMPLYRFDLVAQALYEFTWNEFCDWFVELAKPALHGGDAAAAGSTRHTLLFVLEALLRALHPIIPFITEEIWHEVAPKLGIAAGSISRQAYPRSSDYLAYVDADAEESIEWLRAVLTNVRRIRSEMNIAPARAIPLLYAGGTTQQRALAERFAPQVAFLARAESQHFLDPGTTEPAAAAAVVGEMRILIPLAGLIDLDAEKARLAKEIRRVEGEIAKCIAKLSNASFAQNAPAQVVAEMQQRLKDFETTLATLREQLARLDAM
jgi:valyl-tRNA synthetase